MEEEEVEEEEEEEVMWERGIDHQPSQRAVYTYHVPSYKTKEHFLSNLANHSKVRAGEEANIDHKPGAV